MSNETRGNLFNDSQDQVQIDDLLSKLKDEEVKQNIIVNEIFEDLDLRNALEQVDGISLVEYFINTTKFWNVVYIERQKRSNGEIDGAIWKRNSGRRVFS
jgi:hypothetical protein